jgi:hypothetical protein
MVISSNIGQFTGPGATIAFAASQQKTDVAEYREASTTSAYSLTGRPARPGYPLFSLPLDS